MSPGITLSLFARFFKLYVSARCVSCQKSFIFLFANNELQSCSETDKLVVVMRGRTPFILCVAFALQMIFCKEVCAVQPVEFIPGVENCYRVSKDVYRSGQPDKTGFHLLQRLGVKSVLSLREYHRDHIKASGTSLHLMSYPVAAGSVTLDDLENILHMMRHAPKPILVHCWHGSDRTGIVVAAYRIVEQNVSVEEAEKEFVDERFGHHEFWYGNLRRLLRETDWGAFKKKINGEPCAPRHE